MFPLTANIIQRNSISFHKSFQCSRVNSTVDERWCLQVNDQKKLELHLNHLPWNNESREKKKKRHWNYFLNSLEGRFHASPEVRRRQNNLSTLCVFTQTLACQCATKLTCAQRRNIAAPLQSFPLITAAGKLIPGLLGKGFFCSAASAF